MALVEITKENERQMKEAIDASIGTISFSGADVKPVVFLPIPLERLQDERNKALDELKAIQSSIVSILGEAEDLSIELAAAQAAYDAAVAGGGDVAGTLSAWNAVRRRVDVFNQKYPPNAIEALRTQEQAAFTQYNRLNAATKDNKGAETYVKPVILGNLQTVSYSSYREKFPVRTLGRVYPKSYTRGGRTIAGSLIFTVINKACLWELLQTNLKFYSTGVISGSEGAYPEFSTVMVDQLPPFDLTLLFSNEVGDNSYMVLYGLEIISEGQTISIQDMLTENVMQFVARDVDLLQPVHEKRRILEPNSPIPPPTTIEGLLSRQRRLKRLNPFV